MMEFMKDAKFIRELVLSILVGLFLTRLNSVFDAIPVAIAISIGATFAATSCLFVGIWKYRSRKKLGYLGITGVWYDEDHFKRDRGISYAEFCLQFLEGTADKETIRMLGYDWAQILAETQPVGDEHVFNSRLKFKVILVDPDSEIVIEKRMWEMMWTMDGKPVYPEGIQEDSKLRVRKKIANSVGNANIFVAEAKETFKLKLTPTFPSLAVLMNDDMATGLLYTLPHKGKNTIIFEARREASGGQMGFYDWLRDYFDAVWQKPKWRHIRVIDKPLNSGENS